MPSTHIRHSERSLRSEKSLFSFCHSDRSGPTFSSAPQEFVIPTEGPRRLRAVVEGSRQYHRVLPPAGGKTRWYCRDPSTTARKRRGPSVGMTNSWGALEK